MEIHYDDLERAYLKVAYTTEHTTHWSLRLFLGRTRTREHVFEVNPRGLGSQLYKAHQKPFAKALKALADSSLQWCRSSADGREMCVTDDWKSSLYASYSFRQVFVTVRTKGDPQIEALVQEYAEATDQLLEAPAALPGARYDAAGEAGIAKRRELSRRVLTAFQALVQHFIEAGQQALTEDRARQLAEFGRSA